MKIPLTPPTRKQIEYIEILSNDCGFTRKARNVWLSLEVDRIINSVDMLDKNEATDIINLLKSLKENIKNRQIATEEPTCDPSPR